MKLSRVLVWAAVSVGAYLLLTRTEKGRQIKDNIADRAGKWKDKLGNLYHDTADDLNGLMDEGSKVGNRAKGRVKDLA